MSETLAVALATRSEQWASADGRKIEVRKWTLRQGVLHSTKLIGLLIKVTKTTNDIPGLLRMDLAQFVTDSQADIETLIEIATDTVKHNWKDEIKSKEFIESLSLDEFMDLVIVILKQNIRPLVHRLGELKSAGVLPSPEKTGKQT